MPAVKYKELKNIIKESVKEALEEELMKFRILLFPEVSDREMEEIIRKYKRPEKKKVYSEIIDV